MEDISLTLSSSLRTLIHARKHANKLLIQCGSANQEFTDASVHRYGQKGVLIAGFSYPLSPILLPCHCSVIATLWSGQDHGFCSPRERRTSSVATLALFLIAFTRATAVVTSRGENGKAPFCLAEVWSCTNTGILASRIENSRLKYFNFLHGFELKLQNFTLAVLPFRCIKNIRWGY